MIVNLTQGLSDKGMNVDLVLAKAEGPYLSDVSKDVRVIDLRASRVLFALPGLVRYLREEKPLAMLSTLTHANIVAVCAKRLARASTKIMIRQADAIRVASTESSSFRRGIMLFLMRRFYPRADEVVAVSKGVADDLVRIARVPEEKISVIYNPVSNDILEKAEEPVEHPWFLPGEPPVILGVGRLTEAKDFVTLIHAFHLVRRAYNAKLVILGEGEKRPELENTVKKLGLEGYVDMPGFVKNPFKYMKRATLFVLSSKWEGMPNVLVQALAVGTPIVATDCPSGPAEILENGKWGKLVPVGDYLSLASAIAEAIDRRCGDPEMLRTRAAEFSLDRIVEQYLEAMDIG